MIKNILIAALGAALILRTSIFTFQDTAQLIIVALMLPFMIFILCEELDGMAEDHRKRRNERCGNMTKQ